MTIMVMGPTLQELQRLKIIPIGVVGIAPGAKLWAIKVLDKYGEGALSTIIKGIDYIGGYSS